MTDREAAHALIRKWSTGWMYDSFVEARLITEEEDVLIEALLAFAARVRAEALMEAATCIPTSWLDGLLSGPDAIIDIPATCPEIERLLSAIKARIQAKAREAEGGR